MLKGWFAMKFKKRVFRILAFTLLLSICNYGIPNTSGNQVEDKELQTPVILEEKNCSAAPTTSQLELVKCDKDDKTQDNFKNDSSNNNDETQQRKCYICTNDPYPYFMKPFDFNPTPVSEDSIKNAKLRRCSNCQKYFHDVCSDNWISAVDQTYHLKGWYCPFCSKKRLERQQKEDELLDLNIKKLKNETNGNPDEKKDDKKTIYLSKEGLIMGGALVGGALLLSGRNNVEVHVHLEKN